jgi:Na+-driven multidrug efflux pump
MLLVLIPAVYILPRYLGLDGVWYANALSQLAGGVMAAVMMHHTLKRLGAKPAVALASAS